MVHIDVHGVGYEVHISLNTYSKIQDMQEGILHTSLIIREDAHLLFGFFDQEEKDMFQQLISVSGIGVSTARMMLSYMKPADLVSAIMMGDTKSLENIKGIGKKTAERIILELKDRLAKIPVETNISALKHNTLHGDALNALVALGIGRNLADQAIQKVIKSEPSTTSLEEIIKKALKNL